MTTPPSRLEVKLLGPVEITVDGSPLIVDTKKAVALLAYLAAGSGKELREHLCDLLWPEADPDRSRATLRRTLSALRSALDERWVNADRTFVWIERGSDVAIDLDHLSSAEIPGHEHPETEPCEGCTERLQRAADTYRGPFMEGFWLRDCPDFDDWTMRQNEHHRRVATEVLDRLSTALTRTGRHDEAIAVMHRWLLVDPLAERAHRSLMLLHAWAGKRSMAVEAYRTCVATLERELGVEPLEETVELYEAILEEDLPRVPGRTAKAPPAPAAPSAAPSLVGRTAVMARLEHIVAAGSGLVVLDGEVGVGKTRVLEEAEHRLQRAGVTMLVARAHRTESAVAYGPLQAALLDTFQQPDARRRIEALPATVLGQIARLVPAFGEPVVVDAADPTAKTRFFDAIAQVISGIDETTIFAVDNLHWTDAATLELISHLARRLEDLGVVLILTRRPEDTPIDHPVSVLVDELSSHAETIRLERLTASEVAELVSEAGIATMDPAEVFTRTKGLPFFVIEYLAATRAGNSDLPMAIRRLLIARMSELDAIARQIVTTCAVIGTSAEFDTIQSVSGRSEEEVLAAVDDLIHRAILRERDTGSLDFAHEQLREVAYDESTLARRRLLHHRAATYIQSQPGADRDPVALAIAARHLQAAGDDEQAADLSVAAGDLAAGVFADADAIGHYEAAIALGHADRGGIHRRIGDLRTRTGAYGAALAALENARSAFGDVSRTTESAKTSHAIGEVYRRLHRWEMAARAYEEAWDGTESHDDRTVIASNWAYVLHRMGDADGAHRLAGLARDHAEGASKRDAKAHALNVSGVLETDTSKKLEHLRGALDVVETDVTRMAVLNNLALAQAAAGDLDAAIHTGRAALELATATGDAHRLAALHDNLADFLHRAGDEEAAMAELKHAVALFAEVGIEPGSLEPAVWLLKDW